MQQIIGRFRFIFLPLLLVLIQVFIFTSLGSSKARAADMVKIGLLEEPRTLNIWLASDTWSLKVLRLMYNPLYIREPKTLKLIPWLAEGDPVYNASGLSYTIKLRPAKWSDGSDFTSEDVAFTGNLIKEFKIPRYYSNWKFIKRIETIDKHTVRFFLNEPRAIFMGRTLSTPIVQKKEWGNVVEEVRKAADPLDELLRYRMEKPVGTGPFVLKEWKQGDSLLLQKNEIFFAKNKEIAGHLLGPYIDGIIFKIFGTSDAAILALKEGAVDMFWWNIQPKYLNVLDRDPDIQIYANEKSAIYYLGFNLRKKPFNDVHFRQAVAYLIDRDFITVKILLGYGNKTNSIVPPGNSAWFCPDIPGYGEVLIWKERMVKACDILSKAGYTWKVPPVQANVVDNGEGLILPDGSDMEDFTILTPEPDYDPHRAMAGQMIQERLKEAGIPATSKPMEFGSLLEQVKGRHEFDMFILGYGRLSLDPDYLRNFFHSSQDRPKGRNMSGYHNPEFDRIADESAAVMDTRKRQDLIWEMQTILMRDVPYLPLYNPKIVEGVRKDKFSGWVEMLGGIGNTWSFCEIKPVSAWKKFLR